MGYVNRAATLRRDVSKEELGLAATRDLEEGTVLYEYDGGRGEPGGVRMSFHQRDEDQGDFYLVVPRDALQWATK